MGVYQYNPASSLHIALLQSGAVVQDNYVERLEIAVVLNVPAWFSIAWKIACSLMDERTTARFRICGSIQVGFGWIWFCLYRGHHGVMHASCHTHITGGT